MELARLVEHVRQVRATAKKTEKIGVMAELLRETRGADIELVASYLSGALRQGKIGVGGRLIEDARPLVQQPSRLTLAEVDEAFGAIAADEGPGSYERKVQRVRALFEQTDPEGGRFLAALLLGELRQGALEGLVLEAVAKAAQVPPGAVRQALMFSGDLGRVARVALERGAPGLAQFSLQVLSPVAPMLASTAEDVDDALARLGTAAFEFKLDGARIQLHRLGEEVRIFTRQLQDVTERLPELVQWARGLRVQALVLEGEALAVQPDGRPAPFQVTMRRIGRARDVATAAAETPLTCLLFDCLYHETIGPLVTRPYTERIEVLAETVEPAALIPRLVTSLAAEARAFLERSLAAGHEGLMAKSLSAPYMAGQRGAQWLKLKPAKTLDLVVVAAEWGNGRRAGWLSNLHLGARDAATGQFVMLGKTFKGLTDELLQWQTERLQTLKTAQEGQVVYVRPVLVVEVAFSDLQDSPRYPAGLALRFARVRRYRPDKTADEADTIETVRDLYRRQRA